MSYAAQTLGPADNAALLDLARDGETGSHDFRVERGPDFFALSRELGDACYWGLTDGGRLIGCLALTRQRRFLGGEPTTVRYIHDLRIHPAHRRSRALYRLLRELLHAEDTAWAFATVLDTNARAEALVRRRRALPAARVIGRTVHVGVPLFMRGRSDPSRVLPLKAEEAWPLYERLARGRDFAPADEARFHHGLHFLGLDVGGRLAAVCSVADQSGARRLVAERQPGCLTRLTSALARARGREGLPARGEAFCHGYLSHCIGPEAVDFRGAFLTHLARSRTHAYPYVFVGLSPEEARRRPASWLGVTLSSTTYAYGNAPSALAVGFHELTLI